MSKQYYLRLRDNFSSKAISDAGVSLTRTPVTKTLSNTYGTETLTDGTDATIIAYFVRKSANWMFDKEGEIEGGDALMLACYSTTINKNDKITYKTRVYRVKDVHEVSEEGNTVFKRCNLFLID